MNKIQKISLIAGIVFSMLYLIFVYFAHEGNWYGRYYPYGISVNVDEENLLYLYYVLENGIPWRKFVQPRDFISAVWVPLAVGSFVTCYLFKDKYGLWERLRK